MIAELDALIAAAESPQRHSNHGPDVPTMIVQKAVVIALAQVAKAVGPFRDQHYGYFSCRCDELDEALRALASALAPGGEHG